MDCSRKPYHAPGPLRTFTYVLSGKRGISVWLFK
jgi:hypothetical protein